MIILHIAAIENNQFNGVCVAAPQHVISQMEYAEVGLINIKNIEIDELKRYPGAQMRFIKPFDVTKLPKPFCRPDIVVFHECYRPDYLKIAKNLKKNKIPYIDIPHGELRVEAQQKKHFKKTVANILLFNSFINNAVAIQCLSSAEMKATHFKHKKFVGTNGVYIPSKIKNQFSDEGIKFLYIGRYEWKVKGLDLLFEAIHINADYLRQKQCVFNLYGPDILGRLEQVEQLVKKNQIEDLVTLNLEISGKEKERALLDADIFIQTSRHEGMPMGILEAMSYGIPCLVSEGTTLAKTIDESEAGWNAGTTVDSISETILQAVRDRNTWMSYGHNGRLLVERAFSWNAVAEHILEQYSDILIDYNKIGN